MEQPLIYKENIGKKTKVAKRESKTII